MFQSLLAPFRPPPGQPLGSCMSAPALLWPGSILLLLLLLLFGAGADGRPEPTPANGGLEYRIVRLPDEPLVADKLETFLNELGHEGWRLPDSLEVRSFWKEDSEETVYRILRHAKEATESDGVHTHIILSRAVQR